jgi:hypothetical protein
MAWQPTTIKRPDKLFATATETVRVTTDAGPGFLKALGNRGGPQYLAADWFATQLAAWLGLPTFEFAIIQVTAEDEIRFKNGQAQPGPAFITREQSGMVWSGAEDELKMLINPADIGKLVLFDTWTRNCDRHPPDLTKRKVNRNNVFLSNEGMADGKLQLVAMDHTHCFNCGRDLNAQLAHINLVKSEEMFGLFPEFKPFIRAHWDAVVAAVAKLQTLDKLWVKDLIGAIPAEWQVDAAGRTALATQVCDRADYVNETFIALLEANLV